MALSDEPLAKLHFSRSKSESVRERTGIKGRTLFYFARASDDLRERVVGAVVEGGMSRNAAAKRFGVSIASAVRWVARFKAKARSRRLRRGEIVVPVV